MFEDKKRGLTAREVATAKPPKGRTAIMIKDPATPRLFLQVKSWPPDGHITRSWLFQYQRGKRRNKRGEIVAKTYQMGLGRIADVSLAAVRKKARALSEALILHGINPLQARNEQKAAEEAEREKVVKTFQQVTDDFLALHEKGWRSTKHREQFEQSLKSYVMDELGELQPSEITQALIFRLVEPLWVGTKNKDYKDAIPVTAGRLLDRIAKVLDYSASKGFGGDGSAARLVRVALPKRTHKVRHFAALPFAEIPGLIADLRKGRDDFLADACPALEFLILTCCRSGEVIGTAYR
jgi:hypothetical protein